MGEEALMQLNKNYRIHSKDLVSKMYLCPRVVVSCCSFNFSVLQWHKAILLVIFVDVCSSLAITSLGRSDCFVCV